MRPTHLVWMQPLAQILGRLCRERVHCELGRMKSYWEKRF